MIIRTFLKLIFDSSLKISISRNIMLIVHLFKKNIFYVLIISDFIVTDKIEYKRCGKFDRFCASLRR